MLLYLHCQSTKHQYMPRQERTKSGTGIYHVMLRGINKQDMFEDDEDYLQMTSIKTKMITEPSLGHLKMNQLFGLQHRSRTDPHDQFTLQRKKILL